MNRLPAQWRRRRITMQKLASLSVRARGEGDGDGLAGRSSTHHAPGSALPILLLPPRRPPFHDLGTVLRNIRNLGRPATTRGLIVGGEGCRSSFDRPHLPQPLFGGLRGNSCLVAFPFRPRPHRTLGRQLLLHRSERFLDLHSLGIDSLGQPRGLAQCWNSLGLEWICGADGLISAQLRGEREGP
jgi:hypothetical protein